ncbi:MAG: hypothetical protein ABSF34_00040 [Verrucomicrobiota bacterium]
MLATNIIAYLYTAAAYNSAALQLMVGQANLAAEKMNLPGPLPIVVNAATNSWEVLSPAHGLCGTLNTTNYYFWFSRGRLTGIGQRNWFKKISPPLKDEDDITNRISLIDTNGAYQLATQWLADLSIDVPALEKKFPPHIAQSTIHVPTTNQLGKVEVARVPIPVFEIGWNDRPAIILGGNPVFLKIYGPAKSLLNFGIRGGMLDQIPFTSPSLQVTNAAELIGPLPSPDHYVKQLFGGGAAYETVKSPDHVEAWLLNTDPDTYEDGKPTIRVRPKILGVERAEAFSNILLNFDSYAWTEMKMCSPEFGLGLRFVRGNDQVEFLFCFDCDILEVTHNGQKRQENFDFAHNELVWAAQDAFPWDNALGKLETSNEESARKEYEAILKQ